MRKHPWLLLSLIVVIADQVSKCFALKYLSLHKPTTLIPGLFNLHLAYNTGAAFSFLGHAGGWQRWLFIGLGTGISIILIIWLLLLPRRANLQAGALAMILGGAIGNLIDRIRIGLVIDFFDFHYQTWHWPTFNLADSAIVIGVLLLLYRAWSR
jgi:signal peptidase II